MAFSIALVILLGLGANYIFNRFKLPGLVGMLVVGILLGPYVLNLLQSELLLVSADLRNIALIIILLRAGFTINRKTLKQVGSKALLLSSIPALLEIGAIILLAPPLLGLSYLEAAILGSVLAAVSPAVVVPYMIELENNKIGTDKNIPALLISASSVDDVFVIVIFTSLLGMYSGASINVLWNIATIPLSIASGCILGALVGFLLVWFFKKYHMRDTVKLMIILSIAVLLSTLEAIISNRFPFSGLLAIMTIGIIMLDRYELLVKRMSGKFEKLWVGAQILLFVLVGTQVNIKVALDSGLNGMIVIIVALMFRSIGVIISLSGSNLNYKEKLFCVISYMPKATVQAAIGAIPLALGVPNGEIILAVAVLSILITAPLGAIAMKLSSSKLLYTVPAQS